MVVYNNMKKFIEFIRTRGVIGFAVGFIVGRAVSDLVSSFVNDIVNPVVGIITGGIGDLSEKSFQIFSASINYGKFATGLINFLIIVFVVYIIFKVLKLEKLDMPKQ